MIKELYNALFTDDDILLFNRDSCNITFSSDVMGILSIDLNNINYDVSIGLVAQHNKSKQQKALKKDISKQLMPAAQHLTR